MGESVSHLSSIWGVCKLGGERKGKERSQKGGKKQKKKNRLVAHPAGRLGGKSDDGLA